MVMATPEDMSANCEYIRLADEVVDVPGGTNNNNYANINLICEIAENCEVDAVMPMWGHASENPGLPSSLLQCSRKIAFIGPRAEPMQALGDKIGSTIIAQSAGVPTIGWNGDSLAVDYKSLGYIPDETYAKANVSNAEDALSCSIRIGFPVMIKASEGGGGKGIRKVLKAEDVANAFRQVQGEIPGSPIFIMSMASNARHLEVQLLADQYGDAIALSGRDCSVQRRHQKIIEEGPPIAAPPDIFKRMEQSAVDLAKTVGYSSAGTVEFLYMEETQTYAFLELNPRLQVEHPVTENILGLNIPCCQLQVAMGIPLHRIVDIRKMYGRHPRGLDTIDFDFTERAVAPRHCIAVRVTAENPDASFQPTSGKIEELHFRSSIDVWGYFSIDSSGLVHEFADSQFGHVFASGVDRESARRAMVVALKELEIRGSIRTTVEYIVKMIQSDDFIHNRITTDWLDGRIANHKMLLVEEEHLELPSELVVLCGAALQSYAEFDEKNTNFKNLLRVGQIPGQSSLKTLLSVDLIYNSIKYATKCTLTGPQCIIVDCNNQKQHIKIRKLADEGFLIDINGTSHVAYMKSDSGGSSDTLCMILDGRTCVFTPEYDPTRLLSTVAGKIARTLVPDGSHLNAGEPYVEVEVMKMFMPLKTVESGVVHFQKSDGAGLAPGDLIATMTLDHPESVVMAELFQGVLTLPKNTCTRPVAKTKADGDNVSTEDNAEDASIEAPFRAHTGAKEALSILENTLKGYYVSQEEIKEAFVQYIECSRDPLLPVYEVDKALSVLRGRLDADLMSTMVNINSAYKDTVTKGTTVDYPAGALLGRMNEHLQTLPNDKRSAFIVQTNELWGTIEQYLFDINTRILSSMIGFIDSYLAVERLFDSMSFSDVISGLCKEKEEDLDHILTLCRSHGNLASKNHLITCVMDEIKALNAQSLTGGMGAIGTVAARPRVPVGVTIRNEISCRSLKVKLSDLAKLSQSIYNHVSLLANLLLMEQKSMPLEQRKQRLHDAINAALSSDEPVGTPSGERVAEMSRFIESNVQYLLLDALQTDRDFQVAAIELYIRKLYQRSYFLENMEHGFFLKDAADGNVWLKFNFNVRGSTVSVTRGVSSKVVKDDGVYTDYASIANVLSTNGANVNSSNVSADSSETASENEHSLASYVTRYVPGRRVGLMCVVKSLEDLSEMLPSIIGKFSETSSDAGDINVLHIVVMHGLDNVEDTSSYFAGVLSEFRENLKQHAIGRVTFVAGPAAVTNNYSTRGGNGASRTRSLSSSSVNSPIGTSTNGNTTLSAGVGTIFTYRSHSDFAEDKLFRYIEPSYAFHLDLPRLNNYSIVLEEGMEVFSGNVHLYRATPRTEKGNVRYFARLLSTNADTGSTDNELLFVEALDQLGLAIRKANTAAFSTTGRHRSSDVGGQSNHIFLNVVAPDAVVSPDKFELELQRITKKYSQKLRRLAIANVEVKLTCKLTPNTESVMLRIMITNPTGFVSNIERYIEVTNGSNTIFKSIGSEKKGDWDNMPTNAPYEITHRFAAQRAEAMASSDTLYVHDWPLVFEYANDLQWQAYAQERVATHTPVAKPKCLFKCEELVLCDENKVPLARGWKNSDGMKATIHPTDRSPSLNEVGMVAWLMTLYTPDCPATGRQIVVISNDITTKAGSFGTREDTVFFKASEYARQRGIPRLYLAANSGARIGISDSLKSKFNVAWTDAEDPTKGFQYIYLKAADYEEILAANTAMNSKSNIIHPMPVICHSVTVDGEVRYVISDIIGSEPDLGVENLMGSGLIAGETARAYDEIFTLTLVVGRTVGIGAYLVRLGKRTIQKMRHSPIILTGYQALNKLMGSDIYISNDQLGGPMIMYPNGVSHMLGDNHLDVVSKALEWLSFVPGDVKSGMLVRDITGVESVDRLVEYTPEKNTPFDPRYLLCGSPMQYDPAVNTSESWTSGFFDRNSFVEALAGWAKTVVVGRARLGGIPMGVIMTENRTTEATKPADPADMSSSERMVQQAGGVWFPDSAYKTAQAIKDFDREGLPCIVFANWRGFSGGQRDMFDEVLKFGSMIVDALVAYQQPLFVYIPPHAELRGGAWVVIDHTINKNVMEFYAANDSRGGVLEAAGTSAIKFREKDLVLTAHRLDPQLINWNTRLNSLEVNVTNNEEIQNLKKHIKQRESMLLGVYQQIAIHFCDLHDTPGRMQAKGVIRKQVPWSESRSFFYWRLKRLLIEYKVVNDIAALDENVKKNREESVKKMKEFYLSQVGDNCSKWSNDQDMIAWYEENKELMVKYTQDQKNHIVESKMAELFQHLSKNHSNESVFRHVLSHLSDDMKVELKKCL